MLVEKEKEGGGGRGGRRVGGEEWKRGREREKKGRKRGREGGEGGGGTERKCQCGRTAAWCFRVAFGHVSRSNKVLRECAQQLRRQPMGQGGELQSPLLTCHHQA